MEEAAPAVIDVSAAADCLNYGGLFYSEADEAVDLFSTNTVTGIISSSSVAAVYCIVRNFRPDEAGGRKAMEDLLTQVTSSALRRSRPG